MNRRRLRYAAVLSLATGLAFMAGGQLAPYLYEAWLAGALPAVLLAALLPAYLAGSLSHRRPPGRT